MALKLIKLLVGPWPMNTYIIYDTSGDIAIVDPGAEEDKIIEYVQNIQNYVDISSRCHGEVRMILITHGHPDHTGALEKIRKETGAPTYIHPLDADIFNIEYDKPFIHNGEIYLGGSTLKTIHTPGHTPGSTCIDLLDHRIIVGDTLFVGGPGKTSSASEFKKTMNTMESIVFKWSDDTLFFPGHGIQGLIGDERQKYELFVARGWLVNLYGDVTW